MDSPDTLIVGAGLAGLSAARHLVDQGTTVRLLDKGRSVGGRLATRRIAGGHLDHGAQFFTARSDEFAAFVDEAVQADVVAEWCKGFGTEPDGYPRYRGNLGMNQLAKWMAKDLDILVDTRVSAIRFVNDLWVVDIEGGASMTTSNLLVTAPIPQTLALLEAGFVELPGPIMAELSSVDYFATLALLAVLDENPEVRAPGGLQFDEEAPFTFVADNRQKGISPVPAITLHANHEYSTRRYDDDPDEVLAELIELAQPWIGETTIVEAQLKKWLYAGPVETLLDETIVADLNGARLAFAGDAFAGPKVEGAWTSGLAAARALLAD